MGRLFKLLLLFVVGLVVFIGIYLLAPTASDPLAQIREVIARRDFTKARADLDEYLTAHPQDREALLLAARTARRDGHPDAAKPFLTRYEELGGNPEEVRLELALRQSQEGGTGNANQVMDYCANNRDFPSAPLMLEALARGLLKSGPPTLAVRCLDQWIAQGASQADRVQALVWRGMALEQQGLAPQAAEDYRRALADDPSNAEARLRLAQFLIRHVPLEALEYLRQLDRENPGQPAVQFGLARCYRQLGELDNAEKLLGPVIAQRPDDPEVLVESGTLALDQGFPKKAEPVLRRAVTLAPSSWMANVQLMRCYHELHDEKAIEKQQEVLKRLEDEIDRKIGGPKEKS